MRRGSVIACWSFARGGLNEEGVLIDVTAPEGLLSGDEFDGTTAHGFSSFASGPTTSVSATRSAEHSPVLTPRQSAPSSAKPARAFGDLARSIAAAVVAAAQGLVWRVGRNVAAAWIRALPPEQLRRLLARSRVGNPRMIGGVLDFQHKRAHDVMRPRTAIIAVPIDATEADVRAVLRTERYSRYPVYRESLDDVIGVFIAKDLWALSNGAPFHLESMTREAVYVPASVPAERVLNDLRRRRAHMAIVLDEYGGTAGIVTMEDLIEQVIGDIADEDEPAVRRSFEFEGVLELAGSLSLIDVRSEHHLDIPDGEWTTIGGYAFAKLGRLPKLGDRVPFPDGELEVIAIEGRRVAALRVLRAAHV
jgi:CBS domain containing-hemolysin-like protein